MKRLLAFCAVFFIVFSVFSTPVFALEENQCVCYCKTEGGAEYLGEKGSIALCSSSCKEKEGKILGCYTDVSMSPEYSRLCYTKAQCESDVETNAKGEQIASIWGGQADTCLPGRGHCYAPPGAGKYEVKLSVPIAGLTEVGDLGTYIVAVYRWLIGLSAFIAVIVFTVAGLMWLLSAGNASQVSRAKELMVNAILGMVLILSSVAIGTLIDPRTIEIGAIRTPKLAPVAFISTDDCDDWKRLGIEIAQVSGAGLCGDTGVATSVDSIEGNKQVTIRVNDICKFRNCSNAFEYCVRDTEADSGYACKRCSDVYNEAIGPAGTVTTVALGISYLVEPKHCAEIEGTTTPEKTRIAQTENYQFCRFYSPLPTPGQSQPRGCYELTYPDTANDYTLNCAILRQEALEAGGISCRAYDQVYAKTGGVTGLVMNSRVDDLPGIQSDYSLLTGVCSSDPCGFAPPGETCAPLLAGGSDVEAMCESPFGFSFPFCQTFILSTARADCVNSSYLTQMETVNQAIRDLPDEGVTNAIFGTILNDIVRAGMTWNESIKDFEGKPTDYQNAW